MRNKNRLLLLPIGRRLMGIAMAYLAGVYFSILFVPSAVAVGFLCVLFLLAGLFRLRARKETFFYFCVISLLIGNFSAGYQLALRDEPTQPHTDFSGTVVSIESDYRVKLKDVSLPSGKTTNRPVVVTLMVEDNAQIPPEKPKVGQRISGTGRLFAPDEIRNPGGTDGRVYAICDGYELSGYLLPGWTTQGEERLSVAEMLRRLRERLISHVQTLLGEDSALFLAVMLGERDGLDEELTAAMRLTGTAHILSVSGMHLNMVSVALYTLLRYLPISRRMARAIQAAALVLFAGLTGFAVGAVRALVMTLLRMYAKAHGLRYDRLTALSFAALVITVRQPLEAFDGGFQFSFFVVLGIVLLEQPVSRLRVFIWLRRHARWLYDMVLISVCAQLSAIPLQLVLYGYIPLLSLPMNLLCSLLLPFVMIGGWGSAAVGAIHEGAGAFCTEALSLAVRSFEEASLFMAGVEGGILRLPAPNRIVLVLVGTVMALISRKIRFGRMRKKALPVLLGMIIVLYLPQFNPAARYVQIDVGQGDASLIRKGRHAVVVDVGPADSYDLLRYLRHEGLFVDAVILSHLDEDHAGALHVLLRSEIAIDRVIMAEDAAEDVSSLAVMEGLRLLREKGIETEFVTAGDTIELGGMTLQVLSPDDSLSGSNERSLLLFAQVDHTELLLTGDLPADCEPKSVPRCDVLKVAHHGSKYASSSGFLAQASPQIAVISVGKYNSYGHPQPCVLDDLESVGAKILRTDREGCVTIWLDGENMRTETMLNANGA